MASRLKEGFLVPPETGFKIYLQNTKFYLDMPTLASLNDAMFVDAFQSVIIIVVLHQLNMCVTTAAKKLETLQRVDLEFGKAHFVDFRDHASGCCMNSWIKFLKNIFFYFYF